MTEFVPSTGAPLHIGSYLGVDGDAGIPSRFHGLVASGAPTTGAWQDGDWVVDRAGIIYVCTVAGTPGTWVSESDAALPSTPITGALSTVADAPAKAVLTSIIAALVAAGIATNTTT